MSLCILLNIYLSDTPAQHARGLMYVEQMDEFEGMLFRYRGSAGITMWMKNTYIPLDILFITAKGVILNIARETLPHSTRHISSTGPVRAVLELPGGSAKQFGIRAGDRVDHAIFDP